MAIMVRGESGTPNVLARRKRATRLAVGQSRVLALIAPETRHSPTTVRGRDYPFATLADSCR
jgi:hypothetical protein